MPVQGTQFFGAKADFYPAKINQSLRFEASANPYLIFTPAGDGNKKTYTF